LWSFIIVTWSPGTRTTCTGAFDTALQDRSMEMLEDFQTIREPGAVFSAT